MTETPMAQNKRRDKVMNDREALDENGIEIPYNYANVVVNERKENTR